MACLFGAKTKRAGLPRSNFKRKTIAGAIQADGWNAFCGCEASPFSLGGSVCNVCSHAPEGFFMFVSFKLLIERVTCFFLFSYSMPAIKIVLSPELEASVRYNRLNRCNFYHWEVLVGAPCILCNVIESSSWFFQKSATKSANPIQQLFQRPIAHICRRSSWTQYRRRCARLIRAVHLFCFLTFILVPSLCSKLLQVAAQDRFFKKSSICHIVRSGQSVETEAGRQTFHFSHCFVSARQATRVHGGRARPQCKRKQIMTLCVY